MAGVPLPGEGELPPGPHRDLVLALHGLYQAAGKPSLKVISQSTPKSHTLSHEGVRAQLNGTRVPKWANLESLVKALASKSVIKRDVEAEVEAAFKLWSAVESAAAESTESSTFPGNRGATSEASPAPRVALTEREPSAASVKSQLTSANLPGELKAMSERAENLAKLTRLLGIDGDLDPDAFIFIIGKFPKGGT
jgi:hypothetical protein